MQAELLVIGGEYSACVCVCVVDSITCGGQHGMGLLVRLTSMILLYRVERRQWTTCIGHLSRQWTRAKIVISEAQLPWSRGEGSRGTFRRDWLFSLMWHECLLFGIVLEALCSPRFEVLTVLLLSIQVFWDLTLWVCNAQCWDGLCCLCLQGQQSKRNCHAYNVIEFTHRKEACRKYSYLWNLDI
jgi:hypothetical protein